MDTLTSITSEGARRIAREAYTYGFPMVESDTTLYKQAIDTSHPDFKARAFLRSLHEFLAQ